MIDYMTLLIRMALTLLCGYISMNAEIVFVAGLWGFSCGVWFMMTLQRAFEMYYVKHEPSNQPW